ncbi:MAG: tetratricopeptide (TPR) repeat protein [Lentimonas sp.]|jgi:tetratricopeptide (TPR) repeat protein
MKKSTPLILFLFISFLSFSQRITDFEKVKAGKDLISQVDSLFIYMTSEPESDKKVIDFIDSVLIETLKQNDQLLVEKVKVCLAISLINSNRKEESLTLIKTLLKSKITRENNKQFAHCTQVMSTVFMIKGQYSNAFNSLDQAIDKIKSRGGYTENLYFLDNTKTQALVALKRYDEAKINCKELIKKIVKENNKSHYFFISNAYAVLGNIFLEEDNLEEAENQFNKSSEYALLSNAPSMIANSKTNLAIIEFNKGNVKSAEALFLASLDARRKGNSRKKIIEAIYNMGALTMQLDKIDTCKLYFKEALSEAKKYNLKQEESDALLALAAVERDFGSHKASIEYYEANLLVQDAIRSAENEEFEQYLNMISKIEQESSVTEIKKVNAKWEQKTTSERQKLGFVAALVLFLFLFLLLKARNKAKSI